MRVLPRATARKTAGRRPWDSQSVPDPGRKDAVTKGRQSSNASREFRKANGRRKANTKQGAGTKSADRAAIPVSEKLRTLELEQWDFRGRITIATALGQHSTVSPDKRRTVQQCEQRPQSRVYRQRDWQHREDGKPPAERAVFRTSGDREAGGRNRRTQRRQR